MLEHYFHPSTFSLAFRPFINGKSFKNLKILAHCAKFPVQGCVLRDRYIRDNKNTAHCFTATEATGVATGRGAPANCIDVQCIRIKLVYG